MASAGAEAYGGEAMTYSDIRQHNMDEIRRKMRESGLFEDVKKLTNEIVTKRTVRADEVVDKEVPPAKKAKKTSERTARKKKASLWSRGHRNLKTSTP